MSLLEMQNQDNGQSQPTRVRPGRGPHVPNPGKPKERYPKLPNQQPVPSGGRRPV